MPESLAGPPLATPLHRQQAELHGTFAMKVASEAGMGQDTSRRELVSPLELMLDAAVESERHRFAIARRARESGDERPRAPHTALVRQRSHATGLDSARAPTPLPASPRDRDGARAEPGALGARRAAEVKGWVRVFAIALGLLALLTAFRLPVSPASRARAAAGELLASTTRTTSVVADAPRAEPQLDAERKAQTSILPPSAAPDGAAARLSPESEARRAAGVSAAPGPSQPPHPSVAPAAQQTQAGTARVVAGKRAEVVTVDDLFGVGGNEPLPPEALDAPAPAAARPPRTSKPAQRAAVASSLFYERAPF